MGTNNWALILGGSSGLGLATAKKLARHGYNIIILHRDRRADMDTIDSSFNDIKAIGKQLITLNVDALNADKRPGIISDIKKQLPEGHQIKVMVHSVAKGTLKPMYSENKSTLTDTDFRITFDAMALSLYDWTKALIKADLFADDTRIISFTSEGNTKALPNYGAVSVAKVALEALTRSIALEFAPMGIKANCIQAGITLTKSLSMIPGYEQIKANALRRNPNNRLTTPEDVANAVYLLTTNDAEWITGTVIKVDGGESLI
ncbi:SDR family oxidoreductase [Maribacter hydrothermalis]|uniref:Short-chain dehydrogenase n=1 Tax=Maribacter hydrothermalis TaxID=1836467 RepID=A0A1B7Z894_9FLAO|nr:SDR family oxidoreductase [Maribacter hydrothermalis]APQ19075.1 short-chain dehydrogenase [Maribacter hydrothermalis]OBR38913.1 short-chain dehydrogenase [Maribacter hydrothermalis]